MSSKQTQKIWLQGIQLLRSGHLNTGQKTCQALESLNSDARYRIQAQNTMLGQDEHETDTKTQTSKNSASKLTNPLEMVIKTCQDLESLNSDVRDKS